MDYKIAYVDRMSGQIVESRILTEEQFIEQFPDVTQRTKLMQGLFLKVEGSEMVRMCEQNAVTTRLWWRTR